MTEPTDPTHEPKNGADRAQLRIKTRVMVRKFHGNDTSGEPFEVIEVKEEDFDELAAELERAELQRKENGNGTD